MELQTKLAILNRVPTDSFAFGTVVVFSAATGVRWRFVKTAEETWLNLQVGGERTLAEWVLDGEESEVGYFEVYELRVQPTPLYASA